LTFSERPILLEMMFRRQVMLLVAGWGLFASPALCMAGVIEHRCRPYSAPCSDDVPACDDSGCDHDSSSCPHEGDCAADPCNQIATSRDGGAKPATLLPVHLVPAVLSVEGRGAERLGSKTGWAFEIPRWIPRLSLQLSNLPLLI
jgi:hypothetical protein